MNKTELWDRLASVLFPKRCIFCKNVVEYDDFWCGLCELPLHKGLCEISIDNAGVIRQAVSPFLYRDGVKAAVLSLKTKRNHRCESFLAQRMVQSLQEQPAGFTADFVVAVPQTLEKQRKIGFNQAELLARQVAMQLGLPTREGVLYRTANTQAQHTLPQAQRLQNARNSYRAAESAGRLRGEHILLVDDILTTGATAVACACELRHLGAGSVTVLTSAYTPKM